MTDCMTPLERAESFALAFRGNANAIAFQFGGPLYLVGSMLTSLTPGDIDLRLAISREDLIALFGAGADEQSFEWSPARMWMEREQLKQTRRLTRRWRHAYAPRFDFQFQIVLFGDDGAPIFGHRDKPRLRLDAVPDDHLQAGKGDP